MWKLHQLLPTNDWEGFSMIGSCFLRSEICSSFHTWWRNWGFSHKLVPWGLIQGVFTAGVVGFRPLNLGDRVFTKILNPRLWGLVQMIFKQVEKCRFQVPGPSVFLGWFIIDTPKITMFDRRQIFQTIIFWYFMVNFQGVPSRKLIYPPKFSHIWVDDFPFPVWWDIYGLVPWRVFSDCTTFWASSPFPS